MIAIPAGLPRSRAARGGLAVIAVGVAAALSVATLSNPKLAEAVGTGLSAGIQGVKTVAAMLAERSPGERPEGALANLKPKRQAALHQRALPKVRSAFPAYEALAGAPPSPPIAAPPEAPLYSTVAGGPPVAVPLTTVATPGTPGGPPALSNIPLPGGGGGIFSPPTTAATPEAPPVPVTPVPEPATWAMMILGFALMGRMMRRKTAAGPEPAHG